MTELINDRYQILQNLGVWAYGKTFLVEDTNMPSKQRYILKQLKPVSNEPAVWKSIRKRFESEVAVLEKLGADHHQIPALRDYFIKSEEFYLVQDWIDGQSLTEIIKANGVFSESDVRKFLTNVLPIIEYVHSQGIIHRNIKPENIILRTSDNKPVLTDFGFAKEIITTRINAQGTPTSSVITDSSGFIPLEQVAGKPVFASDLYSLGLTAIYMITGKRPNEMTDLVTGEIDWHKHAPSVGSWLKSFLDKTTLASAQNRYRTVQEMKLALKPVSAPAKPTTSTTEPAESKVKSTGAGSPAPPKETDTNRTLISADNIDTSSTNAAAKPWALLVTFLYFFALFVLTVPVLIAAFVPGQKADAPISEPSSFFNAFLYYPYWLLVIFFVLCQAALLKVPVDITERRQITQRSLLLPVIVTGCAVGLLAVGIVFSLIEFIYQDKASVTVLALLSLGQSSKEQAELMSGFMGNLFIALPIAGLMWLFWSIIFYRMSRTGTPKDFISKLCRSLFAGSVLELLIAVPTHIIARSRDYCCAGFMTFLGITLGLAIMLLSFGPSVFFLFQERWNRLHKYRSTAEDS